LALAQSAAFGRDTFDCQKCLAKLSAGPRLEGRLLAAATTAFGAALFKTQELKICKVFLLHRRLALSTGELRQSAICGNRPSRPCSMN
jgi:hypothetical protein